MRNGVARRRRESGVKRGLDVAVSVSALAVTLPVQAFGALATIVEDGRPILFRQTRAGLGGRRFEVLKLRTMRLHDTPPLALGQVGAGHALVTRTGKVLRRLKIDELPQLLSVVRGDMSLVGPRPALPEHADLYDDYQRRRLLVRPGLTGWAQVNGNTELTWPERILLDVWYVENWSLRLDLIILARTVGVVVRGERRDIGALRKAIDHAARSSLAPGSPGPGSN